MSTLPSISSDDPTLSDGSSGSNITESTLKGQSGQEMATTKSHSQEMLLPITTEAPARDTREDIRVVSVEQGSHVDTPHGTDLISQGHQSLLRPSIGTPNRLKLTNEQAETQQKRLSEAVRTILECVGEDVNREGLQKTPQRYAQAMMHFTEGYELDLTDIVNGAIFNEDHNEMVIIKDIEVMSLCEHHLVPFIGKMHIGYIPQGRVLGLSKFARIADMFSRRLQIQERLTKQVAAAINEVLMPIGVAVVMESSHLCMVMRGVRQTQSQTTTSCMLGAMRTRDRTRAEFLALIKQ